MSTKIRVRNFQAISDAKIEAEGLTVITGRSNLGKTALIRAAAAMLFGTPGTHYIRRGQDWVGGAISIDDGKQPLKIVWRKVAAGKTKPTLQPVLEINGKTHTKIGKDHKQLTMPFGISEIETTSSRLRPQVAMQHDTIFLVAENETTVAEVFKMLGRVDIITEAQKMAKKDLRENEDRRRIRAHDRGDAQHRLNLLDHVPGLRQTLDLLKTEAILIETQTKSKVEQVATLRELKSLTAVKIPIPPAAPQKPSALGLIPLIREFSALKGRTLPVAPEAPIKPEGLQFLPLLKELKRLEAELKQLAADKLSNVDQQVILGEHKTQLEDELKICPTCRRSFDADNHTAH